MSCYSDDGLPMMVAESGAIWSKFVRLDDGPVVALNMLLIWSIQS